MTRFGTIAAALAAAAVLAGCGGGGFAPPARSGDTGDTPSNTGNTGNNGNTGNTGNNGSTGNTGNNGSTGNNGNGGDLVPDPDGEATHDFLIAAITRWDAAAVRRLIAAGADPDGRDSLGGTPLHAASTFLGTRIPGQEEDAVAVFRELLDGGADPNLNHPNTANTTPLHNVLTIAVLEVDPEFSLGLGHLEVLIDVVRLLLDAGADPNARNSSGERPIDLVESLVRVQPSPQEERLYRRLLPLLQNAGGGGNGNGSQTCPAGQTGTPPDCRSGEQARRGPGHTDNLGQALDALTALDARARSFGAPRPLGAISGCVAADQDSCRDSGPTIFVANVGLRHPGDLGWVRPNEVNLRNLVGTFQSEEIDYTLGGWGEWSYFYTTTGEAVSQSGRSQPTERHGVFRITEGDGCDSPASCHRHYVVALSDGLLYEGVPGGTATYEGHSYASVIRADANPNADYVLERESTFLGDARLTVDFDRGSVDARFSNFRARGTNTPAELANGVSFSGVPMSGNGEFSRESGGRYINGGFYGPDSQEAAGTWFVDGTSPYQRQCGDGGAGLCYQGSVVMGSFGGAKQR